MTTRISVIARGFPTQLRGPVENGIKAFWSSTTSMWSPNGFVTSSLSLRDSGASHRSGQNPVGCGEKYRGSLWRAYVGIMTLFPSGIKLLKISDGVHEKHMGGLLSSNHFATRAWENRPQRAVWDWWLKTHGFISAGSWISLGTRQDNRIKLTCKHSNMASSPIYPGQKVPHRKRNLRRLPRATEHNTRGSVGDNTIDLTIQLMWCPL